MNRLILLLTGFFMTTAANATTLVDIETNRGTIRIALNEEKAPQTVANFMRYVDEGFYDGTIFHRIIAGFMVQGGGFTEDFQKKGTAAPVKNEADNGLENARGTIAMARTSDPHSATAQFFINHSDNRNLDHRSQTQHGWGYTVFGEVTQGMDVVDQIAILPTGSGGPFRSDVPKQAVLIEKVIRVPVATAAPTPAADDGASTPSTEPAAE